MNEAVFAGISAGVVLIIAVAVLRWSGRGVATTQVLWVAGAGVAVIALLTILRLAVPDGLQIAAVGLVGVAMSGVLIWLALRYGADLENAQTRRLIALAVAGVIITVLGAAVELAGNDNPIWPHRDDQNWPHPVVVISASGHLPSWCG